MAAFKSKMEGKYTITTKSSLRSAAWHGFRVPLKLIYVYGLPAILLLLIGNLADLTIAIILGISFALTFIAVYISLSISKVAGSIRKLGRFRYIFREDCIGVIFKFPFLYARSGRHILENLRPIIVVDKYGLSFGFGLIEHHLSLDKLHYNEDSFIVQQAIFWVDVRHGINRREIEKISCKYADKANVITASIESIDHQSESLSYIDKMCNRNALLAVSVFYFIFIVYLTSPIIADLLS